MLAVDIPRNMKSKRYKLKCIRANSFRTLLQLRKAYSETKYAFWSSHNDIFILIVAILKINVIKKELVALSKKSLFPNNRYLIGRKVI